MGGIVGVVALAVHIHEFVGRASERALKEGVFVCLAVEIKNQQAFPRINEYILNTVLHRGKTEYGNSQCMENSCYNNNNKGDVQEQTYALFELQGFHP